MNYPGLDLRSWRNFEESLSLVSMTYNIYIYTQLYITLHYIVYIMYTVYIYIHIIYVSRYLPN